MQQQQTDAFCRLAGQDLMRRLKERDKEEKEK